MSNIGSPITKVKFPKSELLPKEEKLEIKNKKKKYTIGVLKEIEKDEGRIPLTPFGAEQLINDGHKVIIQSGSGDKANFADSDYSELGANVSSTVSDIYQSDILIKILPFTLKEIKYLKRNQIIISSLHLANQTKEYIEALKKKKISAIAFEFIQDKNSCFPIVRSMSEIAGSTSILIAAEYLSNTLKGKGEMLGSITGVNPTEIIVVGAGTAGESATRVALGLGAHVKVYDKSINKLRRLQMNFGQQIFTSVYQPRVLASAIKSADVVIGAAKSFGFDNKHIITKSMVKNMKKNSIIIDISIDQGGCAETSKTTSHSDPVFTKYGVIHYCVPNIPARVSRTASYAISNVVSNVISDIGNSGEIRDYIKKYSENLSSLYMYNGVLINKDIADRFNMPFKDIDLILIAL